MIKILENLQSIKENNSDFVNAEADKYNLNNVSNETGVRTKIIDNDPDEINDFINKITADGYTHVEDMNEEGYTTKIFIKSENEYRNVMTVEINSELDYVIIGCRYDEHEGDCDLFENSQTMKESRWDDRVHVKTLQNYKNDSIYVYKNKETGKLGAEGDIIGGSFNGPWDEAKERYYKSRGFKEIEESTHVSGMNKKKFLREIMEMLAEVREQPLMGKEAFQLIAEIYDKTVELSNLFKVESLSESVEDNRNAVNEAIIQTEGVITNVIAKLKSWFEQNKNNKMIKNVQAKIDADGGDMQAFFDNLVPASGKADTKAGELIRAINRLLYRDYNDGDVYFSGYGIETCGAAASFLVDKGFDELVDFAKENDGRDINNDPRFENEYSNFLNELADLVLDMIRDTPSLLIEPNDEDMREWPSEDWEEYECKYDFDVDLGDAVQRHIDNGDIDIDDVEYEISTWEACKNVDQEWGSLVIRDLTYEEYTELTDNFWKWMEEYGQQLDDEYGDESDYDEDDLDDEYESIEIIKRRPRGNGGWPYNPKDNVNYTPEDDINIDDALDYDKITYDN